MSSIIEVAIAVPLHNTFDYLCDYQVNIGARVSVPFGRKKVVGVVLAEKNKSDYDNLRAVEEVLDKDEILSKEILDFLFWSANYYHHPIGEVLLSALP
ncbi:MAG: primosomal protein N', partial [Gammaproteobacteria bacterium]|nr:primosomal protein N' [Gammaproteobacteria bacterium]